MDAYTKGGDDEMNSVAGDYTTTTQRQLRYNLHLLRWKQKNNISNNHSGNQSYRWEKHQSWSRSREQKKNRSSREIRHHATVNSPPRKYAAILWIKMKECKQQSTGHTIFNLRRNNHGTIDGQINNLLYATMVISNDNIMLMSLVVACNNIKEQNKLNWHTILTCLNVQ